MFSALTQACAADPGTVRTSIWRNRPLVHRLTNLLWAPPEVGARPLVFAATAAWDEPCALLRGIPKQTAQSQRRLEAAGAANGGGAAPSSNGSRDEQPKGRPRGAPTESTGNGNGSSCLPPPERDFRVIASRSRCRESSMVPTSCWRASHSKCRFVLAGSMPRVKHVIQG